MTFAGILSFFFASAASAAPVAVPPAAGATNGVAAVDGPVPVPPPMVCTAALRNPFAEVGEEGQLESITDGSPEAASAAASAKAEAAAQERAALRRSRGSDEDPKVQAQRWREAQDLIHVGGVTSAFVDGDERRVVIVNSRSYFKGDYVVAETATHRFVWQILDFDDVGAISLARIKYTERAGASAGK